jgi:hypothetical protein
MMLNLSVDILVLVEIISELFLIEIYIELDNILVLSFS